MILKELEKKAKKQLEEFIFDWQFKCPFCTSIMEPHAIKGGKYTAYCDCGCEVACSYEYNEKREKGR